ncbi:TonB-dependent receptor domain-containing protein [Ekhidna sp.]|uniref:TonB-dependent receptor domain-containing protein n=1 Tax=Ekhidna sp. TaxID=2608089 RepID=UPI003B508D8C
MKRILYITTLIIFVGQVSAQTYRAYGKVLTTTGDPIENATVFVEELNVKSNTNGKGYFQLELPEGLHILEVFSMGSNAGAQQLDLRSDTEIQFVLSEFSEDLEEVEIVSQRQKTNGISRLRAVDGFGIYEAKKNELIVMDDFAANKVSNNARQVFAKVPGLNIWESDFAGLQLDIAARGLGPSRTANFNTRQNGYDMSADALGYPESYYMPAMQAVDRIEIVRGAASLQYGTQFGGMLNFRLKQAPDVPIQLNVEQAAGSFGLYNSFISAGGTVGKADYYSYYQYRTGDGWRENSGFDSHLAFSRIGLQATDKLKLGFEYSFLDYKAQQPGGLTDDDFTSGDLSKSRRNRNWFQVTWNLFANTIDYRFSDRTKLNIRTFGLFSGRDALGNLEQIDRIDDPNSNRTLISDTFKNFGSEARLLHYYDVLGKRSALLFGARFYNGMTDRMQGNASNASDADFTFLNPEDLEDFDYQFPSTNYSFFMENVFNVTDRFSITPGIRVEHIQTDAKGTWKQTVKNFSGEVITENTFSDDKSVVRSRALFGLGLSYYLTNDLNMYANYSDNFRSVTFSDLRLNNPNFLLDSLISDESGFNIDLGIRGQLISWLNVDLSIFYLKYNDRIGVVLPSGSTLLFRTNVGDSRHFGIETFAELDILKMVGKEREKTALSIFSNLSLINAEYTASEDASIRGRKVEYVPEMMLRLGLNYSWRDLKATYQFSYLSDQYSDATNSTFNPNALTGLIPDYHVMDISVEYAPDPYKVTFGVNNLTNQKYFTRRAESYPGPGIIPATIRSYYVSLGIKI